MEETVLRTVSITPLRTDPYTTGASVLPELLRPPLLAIMLNRGVLPHGPGLARGVATCEFST